MPVADAQQLRALIGAVVQPGDSRRVIAVRADPIWVGPDTIDGPTPNRLAISAAMYPKKAPNKMAIPPIVGVPAFTAWPSGPSSRIG